MNGIKLSALLCTALLVSCGKSGGGTSRKLPARNLQEREQPVKPVTRPVSPSSKDEIEGQYLAVFKTVNPFLNEKIKGAMTFSLDGSDIVADVRLANAFPGMVFAQSLRAGTECPDMNSDRNADGIVDALEAEEVYGKILVPLDADINTQASMARVYPLSDEYGSYIYSKVATFSSFIRDLREPDPSDQDDYIKLKQEEEFTLEGKVIVIQGVPKEFELPETVQTTSGQSKSLTVPLACGKLQKVTETPGIRMENRTLRPASDVSPDDILPWSF